MPRLKLPADFLMVADASRSWATWLVNNRRCRSCRSTLDVHHGRPLINLKSGIAIGHDGLCQGCAVEIIGLAAIGLPSVAIGLGPEPEPLPENKPDDEDGAEAKEPPEKKPKVPDPDSDPDSASEVD
jgi:hypothetical protein